jgi:ubiquinone/menaquinone biosynthesis C-methylase UbiE
LPTDALHKLKQRLSNLFSGGETEPEEAYDKWAKAYDAQPGNLMLDLDELLFSKLIKDIPFSNKVIVDVGCGTGRHWKELHAKQPAKVIGYDVSEGMLKVLKEKFPQAITYKLESNYLQGLQDKSCDIIITTLAIAHIENIEEAFKEWNRVLKTDGHIIITDYHPDTLQKGGNRTFMYNGKLIAIKNYVHPLEKIKTLADKLNFKLDTLIELKIDDSVKHYYEKQSALYVFERFKGTPIIYGTHLVRKDATA